MGTSKNNGTQMTLIFMIPSDQICDYLPLIRVISVPLHL